LLGRYQLVAPIGAGGMGRVWVALDTGAPGLRLVALKTTLGEAGGGGPDFWAMLSDEASLASRIDHPNVCATYEIGQDADTHFLVMEWSDGASLRDVLNAAPFKRIAPELAALICAHVAAGLHAAHELTDDHDGHSLGVVHRDVSPQNILVSIQGHVRLADFGVAKARGQQHRPTETGEVKGKLSYMAPEQITSKIIDRRADVFALGCVLYEATLGVRPFHGTDAMATMYKILEEPLVSPRSLDPSFPEELEVIVMKALAKSADERYQTAEDLQDALIEYVSLTRRSYTDKHIAELLGGTLGERLRERNRAIFKTAEQLRRGETDPKRLRSPRAPDSTQTLTPEGGIERSVTMKGSDALKRARWPLWIAAAGALLIAVSAVKKLAFDTPPEPARTAPTTATRGVPEPPVPTPTPPPTTAVPEPVVTPQPVAPEAAAPKPTHGSRGGLRPPPASVTSANAVTAPTKTPARKPRPIDRDNPFGTP
jgi:eukaryotic-like serine/threonine-protein kinase